MHTQALRLVLFTVLALVTAASGQARTLQISFDDLDSLVAGQSPLARTRALELDREIAARDHAMRWSNPGLEYGREAVEDDLEQEFTVGKRFELPWKTSRRRDAWNHRLDAAALYREQAQRQQLAEIRTGYVSLRLLQQQVAALDQLGVSLDEVSRVAAVRHEEGRISGIEARQIQLSAMSLAGVRLDLLAEYRAQRADWIAALGFDPADSLALTTSVGMVPVSLPDTDELTALALNTPELRALQAEQLAHSARAAAERSWLLPALSISGGYKSVDPDLSGYVAGVSLQLPLFSQNGASIREAEVDRDLVATQVEVERTRIEARVAALTRSIAERQAILHDYATVSDANPDATDDLVAAYRDGWLDLPDLLNAFQLEADSRAEYSTLLQSWYQSLFALEALTGAELVRLPQE